MSVSVSVSRRVPRAPIIAALIEEGHRKAEHQRQKWEEERKEEERLQAEERAAKARRNSQEELLQIVTAWARANRIEQFFSMQSPPTAAPSVS